MLRVGYCNPAEGERKNRTPLAGSNLRDYDAAVESVELMSAVSAAAAASLLKASAVRVVLKGGAVEVYASAVPAYLVMQRYPAGLCLARPDVFARPHESVVCPTERLLPGQKFYLVPASTISKLRRRIPRNINNKSSSSSSSDGSSSSSGGNLDVVEGRAKAMVAAEREREGEEEEEEECVCMAKDFYEEKEKWVKCFRKKLARGGGGGGGELQKSKKKKKKKPFTPPPVRKGEVVSRQHRKRMLGGWKPSLPPVQEVSPELVIR
uniref:DUF4228 domain protein n=1 Tax=Ananas comosus var. bracteatus TaxID=296719 RepID=A0A6V7QRY2_ANACO